MSSFTLNQATPLAIVVIGYSNKKNAKQIHFKRPQVSPKVNIYKENYDGESEQFGHELK